MVIDHVPGYGSALDDFLDADRAHAPSFDMDRFGASAGVSLSPAAVLPAVSPAVASAVSPAAVPPVVLPGVVLSAVLPAAPPAVLSFVSCPACSVVGVLVPVVSRDCSICRTPSLIASAEAPLGAVVVRVSVARMGRSSDDCSFSFSISCSVTIRSFSRRTSFPRLWQYQRTNSRTGG